MKYLDDNRRKLLGQQARPVQARPVNTVPKVQNAVQTQAAAPAAAQKQSTASVPAQQTVSQAPAQAAAPAQNVANDAAAQAQQVLNQQLGSYQNRYGSQIDGLIQQLQGQGQFTYDVNTDPLYLMLRDQYARDGKIAMEDTMGQAARLTGGYGNSYAQTAGQQVYNGYMQGLNEMVPQLKEAARADYDAENAYLMQQLGLLMDQESQDYSRWMDELERQRYDQQWQYQQERDQIEDQRYADELAYGRGQDAYDRLLEMILTTGYKPTAEEMAAAGMTEAQAKAWLGYYAGNQSSSGGSSSGGSGGSSGGSSGGGVASTVIPTGQDLGSGVKTPAELGDPFKKEDFVTISADCAVLAGNGAPASKIAAFIQSALRDGIITQAQHDKLMAQYGNLVDMDEPQEQPDSGTQGDRSGGGGSFGESTEKGSAETPEKPNKSKKPWEVIAHN